MKLDPLDSYQIFYHIFLTEMPRRVPGSNGFNFQQQLVQELIANEVAVIPINSQTFKVEQDDQIIYWIGSHDAQAMSLVVEVERAGNYCKIELTSKNSSISKNAPPYASDLYHLILKDTALKKATFTSGAILSDDAIQLWKDIVSRGGNVSVYDKSSCQYVLNKVESAEMLDDFVTDSIDSGRYVFVLTESNMSYLAAKHSVDLMEIKRKCGYPLTEMFESYKQQEKQ